MHSTKKLICQILFFVLLYVIVDSNARPTSQSSDHDNHPRHTYHRAITRKRLRSFPRISDDRAHRAEQLRRTAYLNRIMRGMLNTEPQASRIYRRPVPRTKFPFSAVDPNNDLWMRSILNLLQQQHDYATALQN